MTPARRMQTGAGATLFFEGRHFNPFMNAGGSNATMDDFNQSWDFDRGKHGFVGGYTVAGGFNTPLPIQYRPVPRGTLAPEAAGTIHSDFQKAFIRAEIVPYPDLVRLGSWAAARSAGLVGSSGWPPSRSSRGQ